MSKRQSLVAWPTRAAALLVAFVAVFGAASCANRSATRPGDGSSDEPMSPERPPPIPQDLPADMRKRFEIQEDAPRSPQARASPGMEHTTMPTLKAGASMGRSKSQRKREDKKRAGFAPEGALGPPKFAYPYRRPEKDPNQVGEKLYFDVNYLGMNAGEFVCEILPFKHINGRKVYHLHGVARSTSLFSVFYRLDDTVDSFWDFEGLFSHRFHLKIDESKQTRDALELNDSEKEQTFYWNKWNHKTKGFSETREYAPIPAFSQDSLSALYYLRTLPLPLEGEIVFPVVSEGKHWEGVVIVVRRETLDTPMGRLNTIVVKPETRFQGVLQKKGDSFIWFTDDDRRWVVRLEAKVRIGTVVAALQKVEVGGVPSQR